MKKVLISFFIMTLTLANISSVQAATIDNTVDTENAETIDDDTLVISLENIREIVIDNNLTLKIADNNLKIAKYIVM